MKYTTLTSPTVHPRIHRKVIRSAKRTRQASETSDSSESNDSGLGLDHLAEVRLATRTDIPDEKKKRIDFDDINEEFDFSNFVKNKNNYYNIMPGRGRGLTSPVTLSSALATSTRDGKANLAIMCQPEQQHRARYQTEGSRGAVKDRTGNGFPVVKLIGYNKPTTLQVFIGTDLGRVAPHMFYQACRVSGKNSTPCVERKIDGTVVIEIDLDPSKDMTVTCDCVGILKERNVDVEHRFPDQTGSRNKKKSTRCRMVFRTAVTNPDGSVEFLQICSQPIVCTQPPGVPEICKKSLTSSPVTGGLELFILGKNFLKDTRIVFQQIDSSTPWEESVVPDKEFLQQTHLVCVVPPYRTLDISEPVNVKVFVTSSGKTSDPHNLVYVPIGAPMLPAITEASTCSSYLSNTLPQAFMNGGSVPKGVITSGRGPIVSPIKSSFFDLGKKEIVWPSASTLTKQEEDKMMPPPPGLIPITSRRSSVQMMVSDHEHELKTELMEELSQQSLMEHDQESMSGPTDLSMKAPLLRHLVEPSKTFNLKIETHSVYDEVSQDRQMLAEALLNPPPPKIQVRHEYENSTFLRGSYSVIQSNESSQNTFESSSRTRSGSFSATSTANESSMNGYENYSRSRANSMSHSYEPRPILEVYEPQPMIIQPVKESPMEHSGQEVGGDFYMQDAPTELRPADTNSSRLDTLINSYESTQASHSKLDAFVNRAAESHIGSPTKTEGSEHSPSSSHTTDSYIMSSPEYPAESRPISRGKNIYDSYVTNQLLAPPAPTATAASPTPPPQTQFVPSPVAVEPVLFTEPSKIEEKVSQGAEVPTTNTVVTITSTIPVSVKEISNCAQKIGDMVVPPGPPPPFTGMVPQELVKMTDNDLLSCINPSFFDQV